MGVRSSGQMSWKARFLWVFLASIGLTVILAITAIVYDGMPYQEEVFLSVFLFALHSLGALLGALMWQRKRARPMVLMGVGVLLIGGVIWIGLIWAEELDLIGWDGQEFVSKIAGTFTIPGLVLLQRALVLWPMNRNKAVRALSLLSWACGMAAGLTLLTLIWADAWWWWDSETMIKVFGSSITLAAGGSIGVFVVDRLTRGDLIDIDDSDLGIRAPVKLDCPRCGTVVNLQANRHSRCEGCKLKLRVEFEEPRCKCGYLLYGLKSDLCPECGKAVPLEMLWSDEPSSHPSLGDGEAPAGAEGD